jgi:hypothetical protein
MIMVVFILGVVVILVDMKVYHNLVIMNEWLHDHIESSIKFCSHWIVCVKPNPITGHGIPVDVPLPMLVHTLGRRRIARIAAAEDTCMAITTKGELYVWGSGPCGPIHATNKTTAFPVVVCI